MSAASVAASLASVAAHRHKNTLLANRDLKIARSLSTALKEKKTEDVIKLIPNIHDMLAEHGFYKGNRKHLTGIEMPDGQMASIGEKDPEFYVVDKPWFLHKHPKQPADIALRKEDLEPLLQQVIDKTNARLAQFSELKSDPLQGTYVEITGKILEENIDALKSDGRNVQNRGTPKEGVRLNFIEMSQQLPEGNMGGKPESRL